VAEVEGSPELLFFASTEVVQILARAEDNQERESSNNREEAHE
jgi:hypothetical protein